MASFKYLIKNRARFPFLSKQFIRAWGKRMFLIKETLKRNRRRRLLVKKGAQIDATAEIGLVKADGNKRNLRIGAFSFIGKVELALHEVIEIGDYVCINDGAIILTASHDILDPEWKHRKKPVKIEHYAWIATNAIILPGVTIGKGAVVGAGAVVSKDVAAFTIVAGNPAKPIGKQRTQILSYNPCEFLAGNLAWLKG